MIMNTNLIKISNYIETDIINFRDHLSLTIFLKECPFSCGYCYNFKNLQNNFVDFENICQKSKESWCDSLVITGGEPTVYNLEPIIITARKYFKYIKLDTNGYNPSAIIKLLPEIDYIAMDIKTSISEYPSFTNYKNTDNILSSIELIKNSVIDYEFRTTIIEQYHTDEIIEEMVPLLNNTKRYVLQRFIPGECLDEKYNNYLPTSTIYIENVSKKFKNIKEIILL